jgi:hypothetical protein
MIANMPQTFPRLFPGRSCRLWQGGDPAVVMMSRLWPECANPLSQDGDLPFTPHFGRRRSWPMRHAGIFPRYPGRNTKNSIGYVGKFAQAQNWQGKHYSHQETKINMGTAPAMREKILACSAALSAAAQKTSIEWPKKRVRMLVLSLLQEKWSHGLSCGPHEKVSKTKPR